MEEEAEGRSTEAGSGVRREFSSARKRADKVSVAGPVQRQVLLSGDGLVSQQGLVEHGRQDAGFVAMPCVAVEGEGGEHSSWPWPG